MRDFIVYSISLLGLLMLGGCAKEVEEVQPAKLKGKRVAMIIANQNFRDEELLNPKKILEKNGAEVSIISSSLDEALGMLGARIKPDVIIGELRVEDFDAIIFVGAPGASEYWDDSTAHTVARTTVENHKVLGAICIAPVTLAKAGVLNGRKATVWASEREKLEVEGAVYTGEGIQVDEKIVTADGPINADKFGEALVKLLAEK